MQFNSITFLVFFLIVLAVFYSFQETHQRKALLLAASYLFYAAWNPPFIFLLFFSTYVDWVLAKRIAIAANGRSRRLLLIGSLCSNLGLLGYFKYGGFFLENFTALSHFAGISYSPPNWSVGRVKGDGVRHTRFHGQVVKEQLASLHTATNITKSPPATW